LPFKRGGNRKLVAVFQACRLGVITPPLGVISGKNWEARKLFIKKYLFGTPNKNRKDFSGLFVVVIFVGKTVY
jgi:hypothetical protein